jgi:hypothetical protein
VLNPQTFSDTVLIIFFVGPKKTIPRKIGAGNEKALFRRCLNKVFGKPNSTAIKSELLSNLYPLLGAFHDYTDEKEEDMSYYFDRIHSVEHHAF